MLLGACVGTFQVIVLYSCRHSTDCWDPNTLLLTIYLCVFFFVFFIFLARLTHTCFLPHIYLFFYEYYKLQPLASAYGLAKHRDGRWEWAIAPGVSPSPRYQHAAVSLYMGSLR